MELTEQHLEIILEAWGRAEREARPRPPLPSLEAAPSEWRLPQRHDLEPGELFLTISEEAGEFVLLFEGSSERWKGALLHLRWQWPKPEEEEKQPLFGFVRLSSEPSDGRYTALLSGSDRRLVMAPTWAKVIPKTADPQLFRKAWARATLRPTPESLRQWIQEHKQEFPPRHRPEWEEIAEERGNEP